MCSRQANAAALLAALVVSACAGDAAPAEGQWTPVQQEYRMGSRIAVRERSATLTQEERQRQADEAAVELRRMQRVSGAPAQGGF
jgi:hypothetical protein